MTTDETAAAEAAEEDLGCADCDAPNDGSWPIGSDVCGQCWDRALVEQGDETDEI